MSSSSAGPAVPNSPGSASRPRNDQIQEQDTSPLIDRIQEQEGEPNPDSQPHSIAQRLKTSFLSALTFIRATIPNSETADESNPSTTSPDQRNQTTPQTTPENNEIEAPSSTNTARSQSSNAPVCLICLETLASDDFSSGRAITLGCKCRGDMALRHRDCAVKWAQVKDDGRGGVPICELCKHPVRNLPPLPPRPPRIQLDPETGIPLSEDTMQNDGHFPHFGPPSTADLIFDCIRVTWVAMIVSILFFEATLASALWTGLVAGIAYSLMVRVMYRQHFEAMRAFTEQQQNALRSQQQGVQQPQSGVVAPPQTQIVMTPV